MFKKIAVSALSTVLLLGLTTNAEALSKKDFMSQAKYYGVNIEEQISDVAFDKEALDGIKFPYTKAKLYIEHNEQFVKPILDGIVAAISDGAGVELEGTQYEMEGLVEIYKDYYKASESTADTHTRQFAFNKLGTKEMRTISNAANTDFIIYADVVPLYPVKNKKGYRSSDDYEYNSQFEKDKRNITKQGIYNYDDIMYYHNGKFNVSKKRMHFGNKHNQLEINLRLRVFNTKTGLFSYVSTQRLLGVSHNTSNDERSIRKAIWYFTPNDNNLATRKSDKIKIVLE